MKWSTTGAALAGLGVILGAFGAHALKSSLSPESLTTFETGVRYQMVHALALIAVGLAQDRRRGAPLLGAAGWLFVAGIVIFSGSLYALALTGVRALGAITPFGGVAFIAGWGAFAIGMAKAEKSAT